MTLAQLEIDISFVQQQASVAFRKATAPWRNQNMIELVRLEIKLQEMGSLRTKMMQDIADDHHDEQFDRMFP